MDTVQDLSSELPHLPKPEGYELYLPKAQEIVATALQATSVAVLPTLPSNGNNGTDTSIRSNDPDVIILQRRESNGSDKPDSKGLGCCGFGEPSKPKGIAMPVHRDSDVYNMNHGSRGKAVIFNHENFHPSLQLSVRNGTAKDKFSLELTLQNLGYDVKTHEDLSYQELMGTVRALTMEDHSDNDSLLIVILSHGDTNILYAKDHSYKFEILWQAFTADRVPTLAGKPKMFFVQACQGDQLDGGTKLVHVSNRSEVDSKPQSYRIPNFADFLICYSTFPGHYAWRNTTNGSWFVQAICEVFSKHAHTKDLLSMMTIVAREVALTFESNTPTLPHMHQKKQIPFITSTLIRDVFLTPKK